MSYWHMTFGRDSVTTEADSPDHAKEILLDHLDDRCEIAAEDVTVQPIPYPRGGELRNPSKCPAFCYGGSQCVGKTACPKNPACDN